MKTISYILMAAFSVFLVITTLYAAEKLKAFISDGCSLFPDGDLKDGVIWCDCCFTHDIAYWRGGTEADRLLADEALESCILERTNDKVLAKAIFLGVRAGGHPAFPTWYRWGYGWPHGRGHKALTEEEQKEVKKRLEEYFRNEPQGYCKKGVHPLLFLPQKGILAS